MSLSLSFCLFALVLLSLSSVAQEAPATQEAPASAEETATGTIQGTVKDVDGHPIEGARVMFRSKVEGISTVVRTGKDGAYISEGLTPGEYLVRAEAKNRTKAETHLTVKLGVAASANLTLEGIDPGPIRLESRTSGELASNAPINGRAALDVARLDADVQELDGAILDAGKAGYQALSINSQWGRTVHYDFDEVEAMDETKGTAIASLPADGVQEVIVTKNQPEVFQSLNAVGSVRLRTRSGGEDWHGQMFGNFRTRPLGLAGFPAGDPHYSRQQYGFAAGGAVIKDKMFLYFGSERTKQDGVLPFYQGFPYNTLAGREAPFRENMLMARLDYNWSENAKWFARFGYDNANQLGPTDSLAKLRNQIHVPSVVFGLDWNHGHYQHSGRFGWSKMVNDLNPSSDDDALVWPGAPFHMQLGSFETGPNVLGPRQTIQRDLFGRYDGSTIYRDKHTLRFGGAINRIVQGDYYAPGNFGPSVTSSNGIDVINAINSDPSLFPIVPDDPKGAADNPLNYPVGTITIFNGLGNFSEHSAFNRSTGGHSDTRLEFHVSDTFRLFPNLNLVFGVNYVRDTGRTNSDIGSIPCSAINPTLVVNAPCTGSDLILDQFGDIKGLGHQVSQPNWNFSPQAGIAWDPGHNGRTVIRASGGMFFDNFLLQNAYQDRMSRLSQGQYHRSLTLCPATTVLYPDGSQVDSVATDGVKISQLCGQPIGGTVLNSDDAPVVVADAIQHLQQEYQAAQSVVTGGQNVYSLANSLANFGGMLAANYRTPRIVQMSGGIEHHLGEHSMFSVDYVRQIGTQYPLGIDTNHVGDARHLDSDAALAAINATVVQAGCTPAGSAGSPSQAAIQCYINAVPGASIVDFARNGLDSGNAYCGPFPCSVLGLPEPAFGGTHSTINPNDLANPQHLGSNVMYFPSGRTKYVGVHAAFRTSGGRVGRGIQHWDLGLAYTYSKYQSNVAAADGSGGDFSILSRAEDYINPHVGHFGPSGLDRRNMFTIAPTFDLPRGPKLSIIAQMAAPLELSARLPQMNGGGVAGEIFRSDATGDGTVGDLLPGTSVGGLGGYSGKSLGGAIDSYNKNYAGRLNSAGTALIFPNGTTPALFTSDQLSKLGALYPFLQPAPGHPAEAKWLRTVDLRLSWPLRVGERVHIEPSFAAFNVFNIANFGGAGRQLSGVLDGSPGSSSNNASTPGTCGHSTAFCTSRLDRVVSGSGAYGLGAPRQMEFGVKITF